MIWILTGPLLLILLVFMYGLVNLSLQRSQAAHIKLAWYKPDNLVNIGGIRVHIEVKGNGPPLFFIHGSQMNMYDWRLNSDCFAARYRIYVPDMVGCGFTDKPRADYSPAYFSSFISRLMDYYYIKRTDFIASSWGGGHVLHLAVTQPSKVGKMVLSSPCGIPHETVLLDRLMAAPVLGDLTWLFSSRKIIGKELRSSFENRELVSEEFVDSIFKPLYMKGGIKAALNSYRNVDFRLVRDNLESIACPVLIMWGDKDKMHPRWMMDEMSHRIPCCRLIVFNNVGHLPHEEASNTFNRHAMEFLTG